ncbi:sodium-dependent phosphate transporter 2-like [Apostichopus japonicus]|uniref:sodium-dependent phosphate transporter 2-like n=1 Tax=Stichopus japonicus TaxID=307972 RepID=UPI003AB11708
MASVTFFGTTMTYLASTEFPSSLNQGEVVWMLALGFVFSFILAFGLGANDVANSFATSVGAGVLTLRQVCVLAAIFETAGAVLLGSKVSDTIRKGIFDVTLYDGMEETLMLGQVAALGGAMIWMLVATLCKLPVSGTHSIVGAMVGFHVVVFQFSGINWKQLAMIVASWFISPLMSGVLSAVVFAIYRYFVLKKDNPLKNGLRSLPICYAAVMFVNFLSIFMHAPQMLRLDKVPVWAGIIISLVIGFVVGLGVWLLVIPRVKKTLGLADGPSDEKPKFSVGDGDEEKRISMEEMNCNNSNDNNKEPMNGGDGKGYSNLKESPNGVQYSFENEGISGCWPLRKMRRQEYSRHASVASTTALTGKRKLPKRDSEAWKSIQDPAGVAELCGPLQILSAIFAAFAHGGNDVSNAIGPLIALWAIFQSGGVEQKQAPPIWILVYGGVGMTIGLCMLGRRVIETVGTNLTPMTPSSGFTIELGAASTVLLASNLGIPVSTTHCKVGSIVAIGYTRSKANVEWKLFRSIILAWIVTVPCAALLSAGLMWILLFSI